MHIPSNTPTFLWQQNRVNGCIFQTLCSCVGKEEKNSIQKRCIRNQVKLLENFYAQLSAQHQITHLEKKYEKVKDQYIVLAPRAFKRHVSEKDIT